MARSSIRDAACPEKQLLVCCARTRMPPPLAKQIRELVAQGLDWDYVLTEASGNSIGPLLDRNLRTLGQDAIPTDVTQRLRGACRANTVRCLFLTAELNKILEVFRTRGILAMPYKGPVLAEQAYGDLTLRDFEDLDIILRQRDMPAANEVMLGLGYRAKFPWILPPGGPSQVPGEYNYYDKSRRTIVELHTELTLRHFPVTPNLDDFMAPLVTIRLAGRDVPTFAPEDLLPILCIHGAKDFWERLSWIVDISELVQAQPTLDWDKVLKTTRALQAERMLHLGLALASDLLGAPLPETISARVHADKEAVSMAREVAGHRLNRDLRPYNAQRRLQFRRRMVPGTLAGWRYTIRLATIPAEEDWEMVRLPALLAPLYVALRPLRLLHKYGWLGRGPQKFPL